MSETAMNFEDLISHDILLRYYYCICCLESNGPFIRIANCFHSGFLETFPMPNFNQTIPKIVCLKCHSTLKKIFNFKNQAQASYSMLLKKVGFQNKQNTKSKLTISKLEYLHVCEKEFVTENLTVSKVEHLDISENGCTIDNVHVNIIPHSKTPNMALKKTKNIETALNIINTNANSLQSFVPSNLKNVTDSLFIVANEHLSSEPKRNTVLPGKATSSTKLPSEKYIIVNTAKRKVLSDEIKAVVAGKRKNLNTTANSDHKNKSVYIIPDLVTDGINVNDTEPLELEEEIITEDFINEDELTNNEYKTIPIEIDTDVRVNTIHENTENKHNEPTMSINSTKIHINDTKTTSIDTKEVTSEIDSLNSELILPMDIKTENEEEVLIDSVYGTNVLPADLKLEPDDYEMDSGKSLTGNEATNDVTMVDTPITSQTLNHNELLEERENKLKSKEYLKWPYRCDSCIIGFQFRENLDDHNKRKHEMREGQVRCEVCQQAVTTDDIKDHTSRHYNSVLAIPNNKNLYIRKIGVQPRIPVSENTLNIAVKEVLDGKTVSGTSTINNNINVMTLKPFNPLQHPPDYRKARFFTPEEEENFKNYLETASRLCHGLSQTNVRQLCYQYLREIGKVMPSQWHEKETAATDWYLVFMSRHKNLSISRPTAPNKHDVVKLFENLKNLRLRFEFRADQIWNIDESDLTTVHKPKRNTSGLNLVAKSGLKWEFVTVCGAINAAGNNLPPFMIFPREKWDSKMIDNGPPGTEGVAHPSGYMTGPNFLKFLKFFVKHVRCSKENQCLMILDNHESHITISSIKFADENGINLLTIPTTIPQLQPLERIFDILKSYYNSACGDWMKLHPEQPMTVYEIARFLAKPYPNAMKPMNIKNRFEMTGIYPMNSKLFTDK